LAKYQTAITLLLDVLSINGAIVLALYIRFSVLTKLLELSPLPPNVEIRQFVVIHIVATVVWLLNFYFFELYNRKRFSAARALLGSFFGFWFLISLVFFSYRYAFSRLTGLLFWMFTTLFVVGWRALFSIYLKTESGRLIKQKSTVIAGSFDDAKKFYYDLKRFTDSGYHVVGFFIRDRTKKKKIDTIPILGGLDQMIDFLSQKKDVENVIFTPDAVPYTFILNLQSKCRNRTISYKIVPDKFSVFNSDVRINEIDDFPMIDIMLHPIHEWERPVKRFLDIVISLMALVLSSPVWIITATLVKCTSKGPIFYRQERIGLGGKPFILYKFRSMKVDAETDTGPVWAARDDDRYTRIGKFLRRSSIDELPQLWNILKNDMSLVGPRPERPFFVRQSKELQRQRLRVKPGLTGLAQVNGRYNLTIDEKIRYDLYYIRHQSLLLDMDILLKTVWITIWQKGAY